jgi:2-phosphosulfolactate phosphatase
MEIEILDGIKGAKRANGLAIVIDVFRAFTTECYVYNGGAERIIPIGDIEIAYRLKRENPDFILMGERKGYIQPGFQFGNSPSQIMGFDFKGKTVIHTTTAGTNALINAKGADEILTGSFVNAGAIIKYIKSKNPKTVSLVCSGTKDETILDEDAVCANYIKNALLGKANDFVRIVEHLLNEGFAHRFFDPKIVSHPEEDFGLCMSLDRFPFILKAEPLEKDLIYLKKIDETH